MKGKTKKAANNANLTELEEENELSITKARVETIPTCRSYLTISRILKEGVDMQTLYDQLYKQAGDVIENGDFKVLESMLLSQAQVLQSLFHYAAERMMESPTLEQLRAYNDIVMKANNACRKTVSALHNLKNPSQTTFIKQQNNALNQQVNNGELENKNINSGNKLLEIKDEQRLDTRAASSAIKINSQMVTME